MDWAGTTPKYTRRASHAIIGLHRVYELVTTRIASNFDQDKI